MLPSLAAAERIDAAVAIGRFVYRLHELGFRDRNLDLRNLLLLRTAAAWQVTKIDSPRFVLRPPSRDEDALSRADWQRLAPQLAVFGLDAVAREATSST